MNDMSAYQFGILFLFFVASFGVGGWFIFDLRKKMRRFLGETGMNLEGDIARDLMRRLARLEVKSEELEPHMARLDAVSNTAIQKIGFVRFNPFPDTGGDNSFMLVLLDRQNNGILLSSLYMRESVRVYAKSIEQGKSKHVLSEDEKKILEQTLNKQ